MRDVGCVWHFEPMSQIMPEADVLFVAGFEQCETGVTGVAAGIAAGAGGDLAAHDLYPHLTFSSTMPISA